MASILDSLDQKNLAEFSKDFAELMRVANGMNRSYLRAKENMPGYAKKYTGLVELFNNKYPGIKLKVKRSLNELGVSIHLNTKGLKEMFMNVASKIPGVKSIGTSGFDEVSLEDNERFTKKMASIKDELYLSYYYPEKSADTIYLRQEGESIFLLYNPDIITDEKSAEFKLCAYYGAKEVNSDIDVYDEAASFGFTEAPTSPRTKEFRDRYDPRMYE